ncbi:MAG: M13 family metallopeptidase N-terminal domain-containing protein, partial [Lysobacteraceae bacterium]
MIQTTTRSFQLATLVALAVLAPLSTRAAETKPAPATQDFLQAHMDTSVDPGKDFFDYANGGWLAKNPIPASEASWGIGNLVDDQLYTSLRKINDDAAKGSMPFGSYKRKIGSFWLTAMDTAKADQLGVHPLDVELARIKDVKNARDAMAEAFSLQLIDVNAFFRAGVYQDEKDSNTMAIHLRQGGLGLPERDFYFNPEQGVARIREEYVAHLGRTLMLLGRDPKLAPADAVRVMQFETALANASWKREELRDPQKNYNKMTLSDLTAKHTPSIPWSDRFLSWNLHPESVIVGQPDFFKALDKLLQQTNPAILRDYMRLRL